jgi:hypothetical protein
MVFYSERSPIPRLVVHELKSDGKLGPERSRDVRKGYVREAEVQVVLSPAVAKALIPWLKEKISDADRSLNTAKGGEQIQ